jgi:hypothetical protein
MDLEIVSALHGKRRARKHISTSVASLVDRDGRGGALCFIRVGDAVLQGQL